METFLTSDIEMFKLDFDVWDPVVKSQLKIT